MGNETPGQTVSLAIDGQLKLGLYLIEFAKENFVD
jgi:hypothetical protein